MGQRSQIYVRYNVGEEKRLIAKYFGWNYGERMISRARWGIDLILHDLNKRNYHCDYEVKRLSQIFDVNFDLYDVAISCDIIKEWEEQFPDEDFNGYVFEMQHCNDGKLLIDICESTVKYAFLGYNSWNKVMDGEEYMCWDTSDSEDWRKNAYLSEEEIKTCEENIQYISNHAVLMTAEEVEEFVTYDYRKQEKAKKEVLINAIDYEDLEPTSVLMRLSVDYDMEEKEIVKAIKKASKKFRNREKLSQETFNYGDFDCLVPNDICKEYGIEKLEIPFEQINLKYGVNLAAEEHESATITLTREEAEKLEKLMTMNGAAIYQEYQYEQGHTLTFCAKFGHGIEAEVHLVVCGEDETPYADAVLFDHGQEVACTEPYFDDILGTYSFRYQGDIYSVSVQMSE